jgi:hypothetical protein
MQDGEKPVLIVTSCRATSPVTGAVIVQADPEQLTAVAVIVGVPFTINRESPIHTYPALEDGEDAT